VKSERDIDAGASSLRASASEAVAAESVTFTYHGGARPALREVSFTQAAGQMIGVIGASGAGKSTLAKCFNRIVPEFEGGEFRGVVRVAGAALDGMRVSDLAATVGMVFQDFESQLFSTNAAHEVAFAMEQVGMARDEINARLWPALDAVGLRGFESRDPTSLSGGEKQRLAIASVLALRPSVIILDEPTTDLDPDGRAEVFALIRQLREAGLNLIVIEHETDELRQCDRLILMREGEILGVEPPERLLTKLDLLEECGVHPPSLNRALALLGIGGHARDIEHAYAELVRAFPKLVALSADDSAPRESARDEHHAAATTPLVEVSKLGFSYPNGPRVLDSIDLRIDAGEFLAVVGQNGSGKTTLAKHIVGLLRPDTGRVAIEGRDRATMRTAETAREVAYVFQNPDHQIFAATVEEEVKFGPRNFGFANDEIERRTSEVLAAVGLQSARESDPFLLSKGERQRTAVASVLALHPRLLILDEPTTGLDYREIRAMMALITDLNRAGVAIVIITHTPWLVAEYAQRVVLMRQGRKLYDGPVREFFRRDELLRGSSFRPPEVTQLGRRFGAITLTPQELAAFVREHA
jgi:energy-coupling factor transport system ATP-binding protein